MKNVLLLFVLLSLISCKKPSSNWFSGKLLKYDKSAESYVIYSVNDTTSFCITNHSLKKNIKIKSWLHTKDMFVAVNNSTDALSNDLIIINTNGDVCEIVKLPMHKEELGSVYFSKNDSIILCTTCPSSSFNNPINYFYLPISIKVYDYRSGRKIVSLDSIYPSSKLHIAESPWSMDNTRFTYSVSCLDNVKSKNKKKTADGIYIYSLETRKSKKIASEGSKPVWSPYENKVAFIQDNSIFIYNSDNGATKEIYSGSIFERISKIHWSPNGEYLLIICPKLYLNSKLLYSHNEKIVRVSNGRVIFVDDKYFLGSDYYWR